MFYNMVTSADGLGTDAPVDDNNEELDSGLKTRIEVAAISLRNECLINEFDDKNWSSSDSVG